VSPETQAAITPQQPVQPAAPRRRAWIGFAVGVLLLAGAIVALVTQREAVDRAWTSLKGAHPLAFILLVTLPLVNWILSAESFLALTRRFAPIPRADMTALIGSAWLLNYLPLRPGLFGRVAFHKAVHGVRVRDSARVILDSIIATSIALLALGGAALLARSIGPAPLFALLVFAPGLVLSTRFAGEERGAPAVRAFIGVVGLKILDGFAWTARYMLAFQLAGSPIGMSEAVAVAVVAQAAMLIPLAGNGLGVREWAVGLLAASLPAWYASETTPGTMGLGLAADLACRAGEILAAIPAGLLCTSYVSRRLTRFTRPQP
jgi:hypothetical protein